MPRDSRLYMTFPNDFWTHHKVAPRSDAAFRAFVEMNGYSRMHDLDGSIPADYAEYQWRADVLEELTRSHPDRPLIVKDGDSYIIRDYAQHQQTTADREELSRKRAEAGAKGGRSKALASATARPKQTEAETETETETKSSPNGEDSTRKRAHSIPSDFSITERMRDWATTNAPLVDIDRVLPEFIDYWRGVGKPMKDWEAVWHNGMRKQQGFAERDAARGPKVSKAASNAAEYRRLFSGSEGSVPALDAGFGS